MDAASGLEPRPAREDDWPGLRALLRRCPEAAGWADTYPAQLVERSGRPVAFLLYRVVAGEGEILNLAVDPDYRRQGLARRLWAAVRTEAAVWHLEVRESNSAAIALYEALGFTRAGRRERYYADGEAAFLMRSLQMV